MKVLDFVGLAEFSTEIYGAGEREWSDGGLAYSLPSNGLGHLYELKQRKPSSSPSFLLILLNCR